MIAKLEMFEVEREMLEAAVELASKKLQRQLDYMLGAERAGFTLNISEYNQLTKLEANVDAARAAFWIAQEDTADV